MDCSIHNPTSTHTFRERCTRLHLTGFNRCVCVVLCCLFTRATRTYWITQSSNELSSSERAKEDDKRLPAVEAEASWSWLPAFTRLCVNWIGLN